VGLADVDEFGCGSVADGHFLGAARLEPATRRRLRKIRRIAGDDGEPGWAMRRRGISCRTGTCVYDGDLRCRKTSQQLGCVGMLRRHENLRGGAQFDHLAGV